MAIRLTKAERQELMEWEAEIERWHEIYHRAAEELRSRLEEFKTLYPEKWIAVYAVGDSVEHIVADSSAELWAKVDELGIERQRVASRSLKKKQGIWVL